MAKITDKERLDFCVKRQAHFYRITPRTWVCENWKYRRDHFSHTGQGIRQAIDAAIRAERKPKEAGR